MLIKDKILGKYNFIKDRYIKEGYSSLLSQYRNTPDTPINIDELFLENEEPVYNLRLLDISQRNLSIMLNQLNETKRLIIDTESTGLNTKKDIAWQISFLLTDFDFNVIEEYDCFIDIREYGYNISIYPIEFNKIYTYQQVLSKIDELLGTHNPIVTAHNLYFDLCILNNCAMVGNYNMENTIEKKFCTVNNRGIYKDLNLPNSKLETLATYFNLDITNHHNAYYDVYLLLNVLKGLREMNSCV